MKGAMILATLLLGIMPADAWIVRKWECGEIEITLHKHATKSPVDLTFNGYWSKINRRLNFRFVGDEGARLNGKRCRVIPESEYENKE